MFENDPILSAWFDFCGRNVSNDITITFAEELSGNDAPRPEGTYLTLKLIAGPSTVHRAEMRKNNLDKFSICEASQYTISIQGFRAGARQALEKLRLSMQNPLELSFLKESDADIAIVDRGGITDITELISVGFERRYSMDVIFYSAQEQKTDIGTIERARICGEIDEGKSGKVKVPSFDIVKP